MTKHGQSLARKLLEDYHDAPRLMNGRLQHKTSDVLLKRAMELIQYEAAEDGLTDTWTKREGRYPISFAIFNRHGQVISRHSVRDVQEEREVLQSAARLYPGSYQVNRKEVTG